MLTETMTSDGAPTARPATGMRASTEDTYPQTTMRVRKRNGSSEQVDVNKIVRAVGRCSVGLIAGFETGY